MESSHRNLLNDVAEHKPKEKKNQIMYYPHFSCTPKTNIALSKMGVLFLLCKCQF